MIADELVSIALLPDCPSPTFSPLLDGRDHPRRMDHLVQGRLRACGGGAVDRPRHGLLDGPSGDEELTRGPHGGSRQAERNGPA